MNPISIIKYYSLQKRIKTSDNENIVVMSFNIRCISDKDKGKRYYKIRMPYIRKVLEKENPDIIGFQEVRVRQFKYLLKVLKDYDYEYRKRDSKKDGEANPLFFKKNRFICIKKGTFWLSDKYNEMSNTFNGDCLRICSYAHLKDKTTNNDIAILNTHLDHINPLARLKGIKLIKKLINVLKFNEMPHLIMGDMNDYYKSAPINELFLTYKDASAFNKKEDEITFHNYGIDKQKIDYIALSHDIKQLDYKVITTKFNDVYPSDHYPIETIIKL